MSMTTHTRLSRIIETLEGAYREAHHRAGDDVLSPWAGLACDVDRTRAWLNRIAPTSGEATPVVDVAAALRASLAELLDLRPDDDLRLDDLVTARHWMHEALLSAERIST